MLKHILCLLYALLMLPVFATAEEPYEVFTFSSALPERLTEALSAYIPDESHILSGAAIQHNGYHYSNSPDDLDAYTAMVLVDSEDGLRLYAAAWVENLPWQVNDYTRFLHQDSNVSLSIYKPQAYRIPVFSVDYAYEDGGSVSDLFTFWGNRLWSVYAHIDHDRSLTIKNDFGSVKFSTSNVSKSYVCSNPFYLDYMADMSVFPLSVDAAERLAIVREATFAADTAANRVYARGANLRMDPTGKARSLGVYAANVPMTFTGEQKAGNHWPWYQVRIGDTLGWMSSDYVALDPYLWSAPVPLGRTLTECTLFASAEDDQPISQLNPGTTFHILTEYQGMYHICIPQDEPSWAVDANGLYGYINTNDVLTGFSVSALDAQTNSR